MLAEYWTNSIGLRETSSGGLLLRVSNRPLSLWPFSEEEAGLNEEVYTVFQGTVNSPLGQEGFWVKRWGEDAEDTMKRLIGCAMLSLMPEAGLAEALASLKDIAQFYFENARLELTPPLTSRHTGRVVSTSERPELVISQ